MKHVTHWVFDLDGTIMNSTEHYEKSISTVLSEFGITPSSSDIELAFKLFNPLDYLAHFLNNDSEKVNRGISRLTELGREHAHQISIFPGIEELLVFLRSKDIRISAWTGREQGSGQSLLESTGMSKYIDVCVGRTCVPNNKPYPDGLLKILNDFKHHGDNVIMLGDHAFDMKGAKAAKVNAISVGWDSRADSEARLLSDLHFEKVEELHAWAKNIYK